jgi:GxxExxY protein
MKGRIEFNPETPMKHEDVTERVIAAFYKVYNVSGYGFLEKVYQGAMAIELRKHGLNIEPLRKIDVLYDGVCVGEYIADFLVESCVVIALKAAEAIAPAHEAQLINYLKATTIDVGLVLNFGPKPQFRRKVYETARTAPAPNPPAEGA